jgi:hypothetical protein
VCKNGKGGRLEELEGWKGFKLRKMEDWVFEASDRRCVKW